MKMDFQQQAKSVGLEDSWDTVKDMYATVNGMFGDIVKVTPSSKVVGDMALFMVQNKLTEEAVYERGNTLDFPQSVVSFFKGDLGQPTGGFPEKLQAIILKDEEPLTVRPGSLREPIDFAALKQELAEKMKREPAEEDLLGYLMYPEVFLGYVENLNQFGDVTKLDTPSFFHGMRTGEQIEVVIEKGKTLIIILSLVLFNVSQTTLCNLSFGLVCPSL